MRNCNNHLCCYAKDPYTLLMYKLQQPTPHAKQNTSSAQQLDIHGVACGSAYKLFLDGLPGEQMLLAWVPVQAEIVNFHGAGTGRSGDVGLAVTMQLCMLHTLMVVMYIPSSPFTSSMHSTRVHGQLSGCQYQDASSCSRSKRLATTLQSCS